MTKREKVIKGIGICMALHSNCDECPYNESKDFECIAQLRTEALAILAEQEPRVMTLEEAPAVDAVPVEWIKALTNHSDTFTRGAAKWVLGCWKKEQEAR